MRFGENLHTPRIEAFHGALQAFEWVTAAGAPTGSHLPTSPAASYTKALTQGLTVEKSSLPAMRKITVRIVRKLRKPRALRFEA